MKFQWLAGCPGILGEPVHPYLNPEILCRGSVKPLYSPQSYIRSFFVLSDSLLGFDAA